MLNADIISYRKMIPPQKSKSKLFWRKCSSLTNQSECSAGRHRPPWRRKGRNACSLEKTHTWMLRTVASNQRQWHTNKLLLGDVLASACWAHSIPSHLGAVLDHWGVVRYYTLQGIHDLWVMAVRNCMCLCVWVGERGRDRDKGAEKTTGGTDGVCAFCDSTDNVVQQMTFPPTSMRISFCF